MAEQTPFPWFKREYRNTGAIALHCIVGKFETALLRARGKFLELLAGLEGETVHEGRGNERRCLHGVVHIAEQSRITGNVINFCAESIDQ